MVNVEDFIKRLHQVLDYYGLSASSFADRIGVQRSSISHILSGRNKPSLDFVLKILHAFPEVELYWLLNGKGTFPATKSGPAEEKGVTPSPDLFTDVKGDKTMIPSHTGIAGDSELERIVFFYKDGTFREYRNNVN